MKNYTKRLTITAIIYLMSFATLYKLTKPSKEVPVKVVNVAQANNEQDKSCPIKAPHVHVYKDYATGLSKYINSEEKNYDGFEKTSEYKVVSDIDLKRIKFANDNQLYPIEINSSYIYNEEFNNLNDELYYEVTNKYTKDTGYIERPSKLTKDYILTGQVIILHTEYYISYIDELNGKFYIGKSVPLEEIDPKENKGYITKDFYDKKRYFGTLDINSLDSVPNSRKLTK